MLGPAYCIACQGACRYGPGSSSATLADIRAMGSESSRASLPQFRLLAYRRVIRYKSYRSGMQKFGAREHPKERSLARNAGMRCESALNLALHPGLFRHQRGYPWYNFSFQISSGLDILSRRPPRCVGPLDQRSASPNRMLANVAAMYSTTGKPGCGYLSISASNRLSRTFRATRVIRTSFWVLSKNFAKSVSTALR